MDVTYSVHGPGDKTQGDLTLEELKEYLGNYCDEHGEDRAVRDLGVWEMRRGGTAAGRLDVRQFLGGGKTLTNDRFKELLIIKITEAARRHRDLAKADEAQRRRHNRASAELELLPAWLEDDRDQQKLSELHALYDAAWEGQVDPAIFGPRATATIEAYGFETEPDRERLLSDLVDAADEDLRLMK